MLEQTTQFLSQGFAVFPEPGLLNVNDFTFENVELVSDPILNAFTPEQHRLMLDFIHHICTKYIEPLYPAYTIVNYAVWDGVDLGSAEWHNDATENFDINCLYYFDTQTVESGGNIEFMWPVSDKHTAHTGVYPVAGTLAFINQQLKFKHKANRSATKRRVASVEFKLL